MFRLVFQKSDAARYRGSGDYRAQGTGGRHHRRCDRERQPRQTQPARRGFLTIEDLKSTSGTWVNGRRVSQTTVKPGDTITIGKQSFVLEMTGGPTATELMLGVATIRTRPSWRMNLGRAAARGGPLS